VSRDPIYTLTTRPHIGCGVGRTIYEIRDADTGQIVRTQITPPTDEDCATAVRNVRSGKNAWGVPLPAGSTSPSKRAGLKL
jgi:hypothetical protein